LDGTKDDFIGTAQAIQSSTNLVVTGALPSGGASPIQAGDIAGMDGQEIYIIRSGYAEGDRMKGRFMEVKMKKRSKKLLEVFSGSATIFNSELSDD